MSSHWLAKETCPTGTTRKGVRWYNPHPLLNPYIYTLKNSQNFVNFVIRSGDFAQDDSLVCIISGANVKMFGKQMKKLWNYYFARIFQKKHVKKLLYKPTVIQKNYDPRNYTAKTTNYCYKTTITMLFRKVIPRSLQVNLERFQSSQSILPGSKVFPAPKQVDLATIRAGFRLKASELLDLQGLRYKIMKVNYEYLPTWIAPRYSAKKSSDMRGHVNFWRGNTWLRLQLHPTQKKTVTALFCLWRLATVAANQGKPEDGSGSRRCSRDWQSNTLFPFSATKMAQWIVYDLKGSVDPFQHNLLIGWIKFSFKYSTNLKLFQKKSTKSKF